MRAKYFPLALFVVAATAQACGNPNIDDSRADRRVFPPAGIIQGSVTYQGPHPCSQNGHIVGGALVLLFAANNPPPPKGLATTAINFGVVTGDVLFKDEPRNPGPDMYCPKDHGITDTILASAPFTIYGMDGGQYVAQSFYDYTGNFFPLANIRRLPEFGDVLGGYVDTTDAAQHVGDANYIPKYLNINVGVPDQNGVLQIPANGYVADNVAINIGAPAPFTRPYFYVSNPQLPDNANDQMTEALGGYELGSPMPSGMYADFVDGSDKVGTKPHLNSGESDPNYMPVITMTQDHRVYAQPKNQINFTNPDRFINVNRFQASFKQIQLKWGVAQPELAIATDMLNVGNPFHFQIQAPPKGGFALWGNFDPYTKVVQTIPEGVVPQIYPIVILAKLNDGVEPGGSNSAGLTPQGDANNPIIIIQAITLLGDSLVNTVLNGQPPSQPDPNGLVDHFTALIRPSAICFDATNIPAGGTLVTPHRTSYSSDPAETGAGATGDKPVFPPDLLTRPGVKGLITKIAPDGCLPKGKYGINVVYPDGQAWTVPNEAGGCSGSEGTTGLDPNTPTDPTLSKCTIKPRPVLYSQGTRAVLEVVAPIDPSFCASHKMPVDCCPKGWSVSDNGQDCVSP
jgi:hypothetical protein